MKVSVHYMAQLRQAAGVATEAIELPGPCSIQDLLCRLGEKHGDSFRKLLLGPDGGLQPSILLFVGPEQVRWNTPVTLTDGDEITVLSPMAGGETWRAGRR